MKKSLLFILALSLGMASVTAFAQEAKPKKYHPKHEFWYQNAETENEFVKVEVKDATAQKEVIKFRIKFTNKTGDYVWVDPSKMRLNINGQSYPFKEKKFLLDPFEDKSRTLDLGGQTDYHQETFSITLDGFEKAPNKGLVYELEDFIIPPSQNGTTAGVFEVNHKYWGTDNDVTSVRFEVKYTGSKVAIVTPARTGLKMETGRTVANGFSKMKPVILLPGESDNFTILCKIDPSLRTPNVFANFGDAFQEVEKTSFSLSPVSFTLDMSKTKM
jgi:hypothetical protein